MTWQLDQNTVWYLETMLHWPRPSHVRKFLCWYTENQQRGCGEIQRCLNAYAKTSLPLLMFLDEATMARSKCRGLIDSAIMWPAYVQTD